MLIKSEFLELHQKYSKETCFLSFVKQDHPAYMELMEKAGSECVPWCLERLAATVGKDSGPEMDIGNNIHVLFVLLEGLTDGECLKGYPKQDAGRVRKLRDWILEWARVKGVAF